MPRSWTRVTTHQLTAFTTARTDIFVHISRYRWSGDDCCSTATAISDTIFIRQLRFGFRCRRIRCQRTSAPGRSDRRCRCEYFWRRYHPYRSRHSSTTRVYHSCRLCKCINNNTRHGIRFHGGSAGASAGTNTSILPFPAPTMHVSDMIQNFGV
jgi:hypothetical protein